MVIYVIIVAVVETIAVFIGFQLDTIMPTLSVPLALGMFFGVLAGGWYLAVYITEHWFPERVRALPPKTAVDTAK